MIVLFGSILYCAFIVFSSASSIDVGTLPSRYQYFKNQCVLASPGEWNFFVCFFQNITDFNFHFSVGQFASYDANSDVFHVTGGSSFQCEWTRRATLYIRYSSTNSTNVVQLESCIYEIYIFSPAAVDGFVSFAPTAAPPTHTPTVPPAVPQFSKRPSSGPTVLGTSEPTARPIGPNVLLVDVPLQYRFLSSQCWMADPTGLKYQVCFFNNVTDGLTGQVLGYFSAYNSTGDYFIVSQGSTPDCDSVALSVMLTIAKTAQSVVNKLEAKCSYEVEFFSPDFAVGSLWTAKPEFSYLSFAIILIIVSVIAGVSLLSYLAVRWVVKPGCCGDPRLSAQKQLQYNHDHQPYEAVPPSDSEEVIIRAVVVSCDGVDL